MKRTLIPILLALAIAGGAAPKLSRTGTMPVSLAVHMAAQLSCRTNGSVCDFVSKTGQVSFLFPAQPKLHPKFWLRDVTNILATSVGRFAPNEFAGQTLPWMVGGCFSPLSPRHCIASTHATGNLQDLHLWLLPDGSFYTNTILASTNLGSDMTLCLMTRTNPMSYRVLPDISSKVSGLRTGNYTNSQPALAILMHYSSQNTPYVTTFTAALLNGGARCGQAANQLVFGNYSLGYSQIVGDSSSPILTVINNEAVFICQVTGPMSGPAPGLRTNLINAAMASLSTNHGAPVYAMTLYDVSAFPDQ